MFLHLVKTNPTLLYPMNKVIEPQHKKEPRLSLRGPTGLTINSPPLLNLLYRRASTQLPIQKNGYDITTKFRGTTAPITP